VVGGGLLSLSLIRCVMSRYQRHHHIVCGLLLLATVNADDEN